MSAETGWLTTPTSRRLAKVLVVAVPAVSSVFAVTGFVRSAQAAKDVRPTTMTMPARQTPTLSN
jgi:hypothetical protein